MGINKISQEKCIPCRRGAPLLTQEEIDVLLPQIDKWILIKENSSTLSSLFYVVLKYKMMSVVVQKVKSNKGN